MTKSKSSARRGAKAKPATVRRNVKHIHAQLEEISSRISVPMRTKIIRRIIDLTRYLQDLTKGTEGEGSDLLAKFAALAVAKAIIAG